MKTVLNHVALLVESIDQTLQENVFAKELVGEIEEFPSEGTREVYIGKESQMGRLLLMQSIGDGPYRRAFEKRGAGLHHIALDVESIDLFVSQLTGSGWMLHPMSLEFYKSNRQIYLCRPGVPVLMEIQENKVRGDSDFFIDRLEFPFPNNLLFKALCCERLVIGGPVRLLTAQGLQLCGKFFESKASSSLNGL